MVFQLAYGLETVVLRLFNVYGPRQGIGEYGGVIAQFVRRLLVGETPVVYGDGMQTRDFVYVDARMVVPKFVRVVSFYSYLASCADGGVA